MTQEQAVLLQGFYNRGYIIVWKDPNIEQGYDLMLKPLKLDQHGLDFESVADPDSYHPADEIPFEEIKVYREEELI